MSISREDSRIQYPGNNSSSVPYNVPFYFLESKDIKVVVTDAEGEDTLLEEGDYAVMGAGNAGGGSVVTAEPWNNTHRVTIYREVEPTQETVYHENAEFPAKSHERALDKLTMLVQQLGRRVGRSFKVRESDGELGEAARMASALFGTNASGEPLFRTADEVKTWLSLGAPVLNFPTKVFADAGDRALAVPDFVGQVGVQADDATIWTSSDLASGAWVSPLGGIPNGHITTAMLAAGILSADAAGRAKMADGFLSADTAGRAKMADQFVTYAKLQNVAGSRLLGRSSGSAGEAQEIALGENLAFDGSTLKAVSLAGAIVNVVVEQRTTRVSGTTQILQTNTRPTETEGFEVLQAKITPASTSHKVLAVFQGWGFTNASGGNTCTTALFRQGLAGALAVTTYSPQSATSAYQIALSYLDAPGSTSELRYSIRVGPHAAGVTLYINGNAAGELFGGAAVTSLTLCEIKP